MALPSFLQRERTVAHPGYSRWLVPPAALAVHLSIGQVYAFSVFKKPLSQAIGITDRVAGDWTQEQIAIIFSIAIVMLGLSTAAFGQWIERNGPRAAMFFSACCFGAGFLIASLGVKLHLIWLLYFGYGFVGGIGLGLGYLAPVNTLVKWFPDRPGLATGMAIMGFGGGAMIGSPLANRLMAHFAAQGGTVGAWQAMVIMGIVYFIFMMFGVFTVRVPAAGWRPAGWTPPTKAAGMITAGNVLAREAMTVPQFYLLWLVLFTNTTAGIGIIEQASPMIQEMFPNVFPQAPKAVQLASFAAAGGFVGLLSLFNMGGRFFWSTISDYLGRKWTFMCFFVIGAALYYLAPRAGASHLNSVLLFVAMCCVLLSMYGGGFSTLPAYVKDLFGTKDFSPIYGRLLTAWSAAGIAGPLLVNHLREYRHRHGVPLADAYATVLYVMAAILCVGLVCNLLIRPVGESHFIATGTPPAAQTGGTNHG